MRSDDPRLQVGRIYTNPEGKRRRLVRIEWWRTPQCSDDGTWNTGHEPGVVIWEAVLPRRRNSLTSDYTYRMQAGGWLKWLTKGSRKHGRTWTAEVAS